VIVFYLSLAWFIGATPLTIDRVEESARRSFPAILAAQADLAAARGEKLAADGGFDPIFTGRAWVDALGYYKDTHFDTMIEQGTPLWGASVFAGYRIGRGSFPDYSLGLATNDYGEVRGGLNVPLVRNGPTDRRRTQIERANLGVDASKAQQQQTQLDVVRAASLRYIFWVGAGLRRTVAAQMFALANDRNAQLKARVDAGDLPEIERIDNERTIAQRQAALIQADRVVQQSAFELSLYLRDADGAPRVPTLDELPSALEPPPDEREAAPVLVDRALASRPDLKRSEFQLSQTRVERDLQKNQLLPSIDLRLTVSQDLGPGSSTRAPFELTVGLVFDIPLAFRAQRGRVQAAEASLQRADFMLGLQRDRVAAEVKDAHSAELAAVERLRAAKREAELALELARLERTRFEHGESTILIVNLRETASLEAQARAIDATVDAHRARIDLTAVTARDGVK
jgi:cobalt-zinc-cadmium efflux system outer membrane protein